MDDEHFLRAYYRHRDPRELATYVGTQMVWERDEGVNCGDAAISL